MPLRQAASGNVSFTEVRREGREIQGADPAVISHAEQVPSAAT